MPALANARHERFAQELAKGKTQIEAYTEAGFKPHDSAAARLFGNVRVQARVSEITERAAQRTEITVASITERLLKIAAKGEAATDAPLLSVARASLMDAAKLNGLVVDKSELGGPNGGPIPLARVEHLIIDAAAADAEGLQAASGAPSLQGGQGRPRLS